MNCTNQTVIQYKGLVIWCAKAYRYSGIPIKDLIQIGFIGLIKAAAKFDESRGVKFSTFATFAIRSEISTEVKKVRCEQNRLAKLEVMDIHSFLGSFTLMSRSKTFTLSYVEYAIQHAS